MTTDKSNFFGGGDFFEQKIISKNQTFPFLGWILFLGGSKFKDDLRVVDEASRGTSRELPVTAKTPGPRRVKKSEFGNQAVRLGRETSQYQRKPYPS